MLIDDRIHQGFISANLFDRNEIMFVPGLNFEMRNGGGSHLEWRAILVGNRKNTNEARWVVVRDI